ncbi:Methyl-accepting chemotaxis protein PctC [Vibrio ruber DSM 16370]|uniref:Methyl-accepting chemotaxis protein PctC n=1 Tax=Vibrio ruber (strain DSM 16370 / JCM 11486 / BCRC 17186 / CECT 7878 / LMG 23124 / VR1) TaxID=1123498 RepID=A0A1R4LGD4_VIBR1|nr:Cache 3/Cache 2 fusion domain-containing protein [Vibrio ruber]SJN55595.1 Methyl-accepting chemotaxis protein PctC [Vibrio ruber DSM 16370]
MIRYYQNKSINTQLRTIMLFCLIISFSTIALLVYRSAAGILLNATLGDHQSKVEGIAQSISQQFFTYLDTTKTLESTFQNSYLKGLIWQDQVVDFRGYPVTDVTLNGKSVIGSTDVVDQFTRDTGAIATLFLPTGQDWVRVSTSLKNKQGARAVGTLLGQSHPGYEKLSRGEPYYAQVNLFGTHYLTYYNPLKNRQQQVVAISFIGVPVEEATTKLLRNLNHVKWGETGSTMVVDARENSQGKYLLSGESTQADSILEERDSNGNIIFNDIFKHDNGLIRYQHSGRDGMQERYLVYTDIPGWEWKLLGGTSIDEITAGSQELLQLIVLISSLVGGATFVIIALFLSHTIKPLINLSHIMERLGQGEISLSIKTGAKETKNEIIRLYNSAAATMTQLSQLVGNIRSTSDQVQEQSADVLSDANIGLTQSERQHEQVEQVVTAIEEMATSAKDVAMQVEAIAENVRQANDNTQSGLNLVEDVCIDVAQLNDQLAQSSQAIDQLRTDSESIQTVTEMIDAIAEQTNLLALNAAIEAARAGDQGRGFAVVADEVRTLAQRTQTSVQSVVTIIDKLKHSTKNAVQMMQHSQNHADNMLTKSQDAGTSLETIAEQIHSIASQAQTIATTAEQQAQVSADVAQSASEISQLNQQGQKTNAKTAESASALQSLAEHLKHQVDFFR